jgi:hypothetical protein
MTTEGCPAGNAFATAASATRRRRTRRTPQLSCPARLPFTKPHTLHGMSATPEYRHWTTIIQRCHNKRHRDYPRYGGMGITVCTRWRESFIAFIRDVGPRTYPRSGIVLIDRAGHYEPGNARWAVTRAPHGMRGLLGEISESYLAVRADRHTSRRKSSCDHEHDAESACKTGVLCNLPEAAAAHRNAQGTHRPRNAGTPM